MRRFVAPILVGLLAACATTHGPQTITLSTGEIEQQLQADLGRAVEMFREVDTRRPEVSLMPASGRLLLGWKFRLPDGPTGTPVGIEVELSGKPVLNATRNGIDRRRRSRRWFAKPNSSGRVRSRRPSARA